MGSEQSSQAGARAAARRAHSQAQAAGQPSRSASVDSSVITPEGFVYPGLKPISSLGSEDNLRGPSNVQRGPRAIPKEIIIVSRGDEGEEELFRFPPPFKPLIPIGHESLQPGVQQLNPQFLVNMGLALEEQLKSRADFINGQQTVLNELIREMDFVTNFLTNNILVERQKRVVKVTENFNKFTDINKLLDKIEADLDICLVRLDALNRALPPESRLEKFTGSLNGLE